MRSHEFNVFRYTLRFHRCEKQKKCCDVFRTDPFLAHLSVNACDKTLLSRGKIFINHGKISIIYYITHYYDR